MKTAFINKIYLSCFSYFEFVWKTKMIIKCLQIFNLGPGPREIFVWTITKYLSLRRHTCPVFQFGNFMNSLSELDTARVRTFCILVFRDEQIWETILLNTLTSKDQTFLGLGKILPRLQTTRKRKPQAPINIITSWLLNITYLSHIILLQQDIYLSD